MINSWCHGLIFPQGGLGAFLWLTWSLDRAPLLSDPAALYFVV